MIDTDRKGDAVFELVALKRRPSGTNALAERFYNRFRRHSPTGYQTAVGKELGHQAA